MKKKPGKSGQTMVEYSLILGIMVLAFMAVTPLIKRDTQAMVKTVADEIGLQTNSDQQGDGFLDHTTVMTAVSKKEGKKEFNIGSTHSIQTSYDDQSATSSVSKTDMGTTAN